MKRLLTAAGLLVASSLAVAEAPEAGTGEDPAVLVAAE